MHWVNRYSGLFVIIFSWTLLVFPYLILKSKHNLRFVSDMIRVKGYRYILCSSLVLISLFQIAFWFYFAEVLTFVSAQNIAILVVGSLSLLFAGAIPRDKYKKLHDFLARAYFSISIIGSALLSGALGKISTTVMIVELFVVCVMGIGMIVLYKRFRDAKAQIWVIFFSSIWMIIIYLYIL